MRKEYKNPEIQVATFAAENICTLSGTATTNIENLSPTGGYATATVSFSSLIDFS